MKKHGITLALGWAALFALGLGTAWAVGQDHFGRSTPLPNGGLQAHDGPEWIAFNVHDHGVGLRVKREALLPGLPMPLVMRVVDLGPDVYDMQSDIEPATASIWINGHGPLEFEPVTPGVLEVSIPRRLLNFIADDDVSVMVWGPSGQVLVDLTGRVPLGF